MPTWEDIINQVTIPGDGTAISNAKGEWELVFRRIRDAKRFLDDGLADLEAWKGPAGQVYRDNVARIAKTLDQVDTDNSAVVHQLAEAATNMSTAISTIPIPAEMAHFVLEAKENFQLRWELAGFGQNAFADFLLSLIHI